MRLLIDSQTLIWFVDQDHLLSRPAHAAITDPASEMITALNGCGIPHELSSCTGACRVTGIYAPIRRDMNRRAVRLAFPRWSVTAIKLSKKPPDVR